VTQENDETKRHESRVRQRIKKAVIQIDKKAKLDRDTRQQ
jgi:hypothetical protein